MAKRQYRQLFLRLGRHEGSRLPVIVVCSNFGFGTWQAALHHFRQALVELTRANMEDSCPRCRGLKQGPDRKYCDLCGSPLPVDGFDDTLNAEVADYFRKWFDLEFHQFSDWEVLESEGWLVGHGTTLTTIWNAFLWRQFRRGLSQ